MKFIQFHDRICKMNEWYRDVTHKIGLEENGLD